MHIELRSYLGTAVFTKNGQAVGKLADVEFDSDTGHLLALIVKTKGLLPGLLDDTVIVPWNAVIELNKDQVVIADGTVPASGLARITKPATPAPGLMKEG